MLLSITTTHDPASDLSFLLHKRPDRCQQFSLSFGTAWVFYPECSTQRCTACLLLEVDALGLARSRTPGDGRMLADYVNDRPFVASSLLSVAIAQVLSSAVKGRCRDRPALASQPIPLEARIDVLKTRGGDARVRNIFEPLGYAVECRATPLDPRFADWGNGPYRSVTLRKESTLSELLNHLYVLLPVFDGQKHYYVGPDECEKLLARGEGWLATHPERNAITRGYLKNQRSLVRATLDRLEETPEPADGDDGDTPLEPPEVAEARMSLNEQRLAAVVEVLKAAGGRRVIDLGCGEGKLLKRLADDPWFTRIVGLDVAPLALERAAQRLGLASAVRAYVPTSLAETNGAGVAGGADARVAVVQGSLVYRDPRLTGFDAACLIEVIEHLDPSRLAALERCVFETARPKCVVLTTPNREYNSQWPSLPAGQFRHRDHRFEWSRAECLRWADAVAERCGYRAEIRPVGPEHPELGAPTQMVIFERSADSAS